MSFFAIAKKEKLRLISEIGRVAASGKHAVTAHQERLEVSGYVNTTYIGNSVGGATIETSIKLGETGVVGRDNVNGSVRIQSDVRKLY